ncbi:transcriptional regulator [Clostridium manihotivorum]|uniref:Transcriptional regulator n=1 Tax=Clostridium manihotivorum TaxID=2320868 RepID=A0A3R5QSK3_9CLOT|nr:transcriptional regulator [Clostridium manihotivorum]
MNRRYRDILSIILNTEEAITGSELAKFCKVSVRTIRQDIKDINILLKEYEVEISSNVKKGYFFDDKSKSIMKESNIIRKVLDYQYIIETPSIPIDRQMYILLKLIVKENMEIEEVAEVLYVSSATINNDIAAINKWLKKELNLRISYSLNEGISLNAEEVERRNIISWVLSKKTNVSTIAKYWNYIFEESDVIERARQLYHIVSNNAKKHNYYLSGHSYQLLCYEILVAIKRCENGFSLKEEDITKECLVSVLPVLMDIRVEVEKLLKMKLSELEWLNIQCYFKSKQFLKQTSITNFENEEAMEIVDEFIQVLKHKFKIDISSNKETLLLYVNPMINRLRYKHCIAEQINDGVTKTYKRQFEMAGEIAGIIKRRLKLNVELIELAYITVHLVAICETEESKLKTAIVCDYDEAIISLIKYKLKKLFGERVELLRVFDYQEFMFEEEENLKDIEFIVTTSTIADLTDIPFVKINPEFEQNDINMLSEHFNNHINK